MKYFLFSVILAVVCCTNNPEFKEDDQKARDALVGVWRGSGEFQDEEDQGWNEFWKIIRHKDGTFKVSYLLVHDGNKKYEITSDSGRWGYENGAYYEIYDNDLKTVYKVYSVKKDWFEYNQIQRGGKIEEIKTAETYQLQDPPEGYTEIVHQETE